MKILKRSSITFILVLLLAAKCSRPNNTESSDQTQRQNIIFILVDDLGWTDVGYNGSTFYETPNIDSLSAASILFTNAYSSASVCSPTRASILTGKHPARVNITDWIPGDDPQNQKLIGPEDLNELPLAEITLAEVLKENGYKTFFAGKWHLGGSGYLPENQGFETNIGGLEVGQPPGGYYSPYKNSKLPDGPDGEYLTDRITDESVKFLESVGSTPFFLFLPYYTVHTPIEANKKHIEKFRSKLEALEDKEIEQRIDGNGITTLNQCNPDYASMIFALDENIGRIITTIKERGLYTNTTIIFTSDNGGLSTLRSGSKGKAPTSVTPLRAGKGWLYEGGIRVPLLIKPANYQSKNSQCDVPVISHDFYPTIISLAGLKMPIDQIIDGVDLGPLLQGENVFAREELFWHYPHYHGSGWTPGAAIRQGNWKLIEFYDTNTLELYNLADDISETNDLSHTYPEKVIALKSKLHNLQQSVGAKQPTPNPAYKN